MEDPETNSISLNYSLNIRKSILQFIVLYLLSLLVYGLLIYWDIHFDGYFDQTAYVQHSFKGGLPTAAQLLCSGFLSWKIIMISIVLLGIGKLYRSFFAGPAYMLVWTLSLMYTVLVLTVFRFTLSRGFFYIPDEIIIAILAFGLVGILPIKAVFRKQEQ